MKIKFNPHDELPLNKPIEIPSIIIVVKAIFHENNKYYPQVFFVECFDKLQMQKKQKYNLQNKKFYILLAFLLIIIALLIAIGI